MIPKIIHYIWLGNNPLPKIAEKCIASWKKYCPDYEIKCWNEQNLDISQFPFAKAAYDNAKYAFASDVLRTSILYQYGGIYLDIDVELIQPIDEFLDVDCFMGFETSCLLASGLITGSVKGNPDLKAILDRYQNLTFELNRLSDLTVCEIYTSYYEELGLQRKNETQKIGNTVFYASEYFSPIDVISNKFHKTENTHSIHWYSASWYSSKQKLKRKIKIVLNFFTFGLFGKILLKVRAMKNNKK